MFSESITAISRDLADKKYRSVDITQHYLDRIKQYDPSLNSYITVCADHALAAATAADQVRAEGKTHPLCGVPIAHKDIFCTQGIKTTCGSKMLENFIAPYESTVTQRCQQAGMVMLGKTNMDEFAMGSSNEHSYYGACKNPWQPDHVPGGSSGGSAAAVAAKLTPIATGSDTGGSVRQPAAFCGITGLKPTYGRISRYGMIAFASSLDQAGIMAQDCQDTALLLNILAGHDKQDATSVDHPVDDYTSTLEKSVESYTLGIPRHFFVEHLSREQLNHFDDAVNQFEAMGVRCVDINLATMERAIPTYYVLASAECSSNLSRFDGVRYGYRCQNAKNLNDLYTRSRSEAFGAEVKRRILLGTHVLSSGYYDAYYNQAQKVRRLIRDHLCQALTSVDAILLPTTPGPAFTLNANPDPTAMYLADIFTTPASLAGLPALSLPFGQENGLPLGIQLIGRHFDETRLLQLGHQLQQRTHWHQASPALTQGTEL
jgi:aspartyl-tRNA(Asn)/glutamyl-tRNA(Gln) amidotransferase subunit A